MGAEVWVAVYAAVVATGALFLEVRRWFESGPRIVLAARPNMMMGGAGEEWQRGLLVVTAYNRGDMSTTVTGLGLLEFPGWWARLRRKPTASFVIMNPQPDGFPPNVPSELKPGGQWMGIGRPREDETGDIENGRFWAALYTTDRDRPYLAHIPKAAPKEEADRKEI